MAESVAEEYKSSLADLSCNSKPLINMLTILAEENIKYAAEIVKTISDHVVEVSPECKLPCLYLIDSIIKNVRKQYLNLFAQNIIHIFASVFEKVDENTRMLLYKLRQTWNEIFPNKILYKLDMRVKEVDPAWPVTAKPPSQIHVNPKFLGPSNTQPSETPVLIQKQELKAKQEVELKKLLAKQEQLRLLEMKKLELGAKRLANSNAAADLAPSVTAGTVQQRVDPRIVAKLNPKLSQRDPRLHKVVIASVLEKNLIQNKIDANQKKEIAQAVAANSNVPKRIVSVTARPPAEKLCDKPSEQNVVNKKDPSSESSAKPKITDPKPEPVVEKQGDSNIVASSKSDKKSKSEKENSSKREPGSKSPSPVKKKKKLNDSKKGDSVETSPKKSLKSKDNKKSDSPKKSPQKASDSGDSKRHRHSARSPVRKSDKKSTNRVEHPVKEKKKSESDADVGTKSDRRSKRTELKEVDTDLRKIGRDGEQRNKREIPEEIKENFKEPPEKKIKEESEEKSAPDSLFGNEDQDYRQLTKEGKSPHHKGWALYKAAHPDEFKSPRRPSIHGRDIENRHPDYEEYQREKLGLRPFREPFDRGSIEYDRLGRPRLFKMRRNERFGMPIFHERDSPFMYPERMAPSDTMFRNFFVTSVLQDPKDVLRQAEERFRLGRISEADFNDIRRELGDLERVRCSEEFMKVHQDFSRMAHFGNMAADGPEGYMKVRNTENLHPAFRDVPPPPGHRMPSVRTFRLDNKSRTLHFVDDRAIVLMDNGEPRELTFRGEPTPVFIQGLKPIMLRFDNKPIEFELDGKLCSMKFGTPSRELYINNRPYEAKFGGPPFDANINGRVYRIGLGGPPPQVQVSEHPANDLFHKFQALSRMNPDMMGPLPSGEALKDHSNKMPFDVDMRPDPSQPPVSRNADLRDIDWRHSSDHQEKSRNYDFPTNGAPFSKEQLQRRPEPQFLGHPDHKPYDGTETDFRPFPHDQGPPRHPEWRNFPPPPQFPAANRNYNSPHQSPPRDAPPGEWDQPLHPPVSRPYNPPPDNAFEPISRPWRQREFNTEGPRPIHPPVSETGNLYVTQRNSPKSFEPYHEGEPSGPLPPPPLPPPAAKFPMPVMPRPPFNPCQIRPEFVERPPAPGILPRPPLPPWMNNPPPPQVPTENTRHPALPPPPQPPPHMRMPFTPVPQPVVSNEPPPSMDAETANPPPAVPPAPTPGILPTPAPSLSENQTVTDDAQPEPVQAMPARNPYVVNLDVTTLFEKLVAAGIISKPKPEVASEAEPIAEAEDDSDEAEAKKDKETDPNEEIVPPIELKMESLKTRHTGVISALYRGSQCASCGMRFKEIHGERYSRHLDWHFRVNRREKDGAKKAFSRKWYYEVEDWIQFEEFEDFEERARSFFELQADEQFQMEAVKTEVPSVPVSGQESEACVVCGELFQLFWVEEEEEWHLRNAIRHEGQAYHPSCYDDFKKATEAAEKEAAEKEAAEKEAAERGEDAVEIKEEPVVVKQEPEDVDEEFDSIISEVVQMLADTTVQSCEEAESVKVESIKEEEKEMEVEKEKEDEPKEEEQEEEEEEEIELEGKPGEEEIIGLITEEEETAPEPAPTDDSEKLVFQSGGIKLKVRAESLKPASPQVDSAAAKEVAKETVEEAEEEPEFRPPTPDPRFQVLPPVQRGTELSGLCTIM